MNETTTEEVTDATEITTTDSLTTEMSTTEGIIYLREVRHFIVFKIGVSQYVRTTK